MVGLVLLGIVCEMGAPDSYVYSVPHDDFVVVVCKSVVVGAGVSRVMAMFGEPECVECESVGVDNACAGAGSYFRRSVDGCRDEVDVCYVVESVVLTCHAVEAGSDPLYG